MAESTHMVMEPHVGRNVYLYAMLSYVYLYAMQPTSNPRLIFLSFYFCSMTSAFKHVLIDNNYQLCSTNVCRPNNRRVTFHV